jgi:hypothetical protein
MLRVGSVLRWGDGVFTAIATGTRWKLTSRADRMIRLTDGHQIFSGAITSAG